MTGITNRFTVSSLFPDLVADKFTGPLPMSVQQGTNADMVHRFRDVYFGHNRAIVDLTYGSEGGWWKRHRPDGLVVSEHDFTDLPADWTGRFGTTCYDPPYVQTGGAATKAELATGFRDRFGINDLKRSESELLTLILDGATEAARITDPDDGFLCVKAMDFVGSSRFCDWTYAVHAHITGEKVGMYLHDEIVHNAGPGPGGHNIAAAKRARRAHSKLLVFTWRCIR